MDTTTAPTTAYQLTPASNDPRLDSSTPASPPLTSASLTNADKASVNDDDAPHENPKKGLRFWLIIFSLLVATFLSALDLTAISTALPKIAAELESQDYAWIGNAYSITSTCFIPWSGGFADVFGRRPILLVGLVLFAVGSAMCGAANEMNVMLAGRAFQGAGSGIILSLVEIILADLVSLAERGAYQGAFGAVWALASATGPPIGGALASSNYRWLFYLNLPLTAVIIGVVAAFVNLKTPSGTIRSKLARMDWLGNLIFIPSITLLIVGLLKGGQPDPWSSAGVIAPLIIGAVGLIAWYLVERYYVAHPTVPFELLMNRTTAIGYATTWLQGVSAMCLFYFWPVYFQAVKGASPVESAVDFFSVAFIVAPFAMATGASIGILQFYRPQNVIAWVLMTVGPGILSLVSANSPKAAWVPLPIVFSIGIGMLFPATVFPVLAPLPPSLAGRALSFHVFTRNLGNVFGITVGSTVLAQELGKRLPAEFLAMTPGGVAGAYAAIPSISSLPEPLKEQVRIAFAQSIRVIWLVVIPFGAIGLALSLFMKELKLETVTDAQWGLEHKAKKDAEQVLEEKASS